MGRLVLTHKQDESTVCLLNGKAVWVTVVEIRGDKVRLLFEAADDVRIYREAVLDKMDAAEREKLMGAA